MSPRFDTNLDRRMPESETSIVYVIDDDESIRFTLQSLVRSVGLRVQTFESPTAFLAWPKDDVPSCLVLDVRLQGESGLGFQEDMAQLGLHIPIIFMTAYADVEMTVTAMKAGALDFFQKPFRDQNMLDAIAHALKGDAQRLAGEQAQAGVFAAYGSLTVREKEVMKYVVAGLLNKQIAYEMNLSEVTVKIHRGQVMKKMAARSLPDLVRKAESLHETSARSVPARLGSVLNAARNDDAAGLRVVRSVERLRRAPRTS
ncbi:hypothetical protein BG57_32560 [Caballeronia grimmiae]|uniref:LuxR family transcriptional regulator n=2 Tax=Caballeronia grimmiae TaxID=1071679 RepID=A0A069P333_9BURK|nr:response regulator [Caballeronia grimmiae]KDR35075.1 hypothetical protein BG57_32560 [Caballeronia grimmiae]